jgi:hypothetical protein
MFSVGYIYRFYLWTQYWTLNWISVAHLSLILWVSLLLVASLITVQCPYLCRLIIGVSMTRLVGNFFINVTKSQASYWNYEYLFLNNTVNEWFLFKFNEMRIIFALVWRFLSLSKFLYIFCLDRMSGVMICAIALCQCGRSWVPTPVLVGKFIINVTKSQASNWKYEYLFLNNTVNEWFLFKFRRLRPKWTIYEFL